MTDITRIRQVFSDGAAERDRLTTELSATTQQLAQAKERLRLAQTSGDAAAVNEAAARIRMLSEKRLDASQGLGAERERLRADLDDLLHADLALEGNVPLALLPVRVETRSSSDGKNLRVRVFHDTLHVETLEEGLTDSERSAGIAYWKAIWPTGENPSAWPTLLAAVGGSRVAWVAEALRPSNLASRPAAVPNFPGTSPRARARAVARTLPDRFYVRVEQDGAAPFVTHGHAIPDELPVGLTGQDELAPLEIANEDLPPVDASLRWLVDYAEAERLGMAITVPLPLPGKPVRRLLVYGVRSTLDADASAGRLERLVRSHRFTDGAQFVAQGTPTNNSDSARTDWSRLTSPGAPALDLLEPAPGSNAAVMASALGVDPATLVTLAGASDSEQSRARAFNTALWETTWGDAIEHLTPAGRANGDKRLDNPSLEAVRDHWVSNVRGRGPLPVLRLGRQPYGVLPVVCTDASFRPLRGGFVEDRLVPFIDQQARPFWNDAAPAATVTNRPLDSALPEILGTDAILRGLRVRSALSPDPVIAKGISALTLPDIGDAGRQQVTDALLVLSGVANDALDEHDLLSTKTRGLALPLVHDTDQAFITAMLLPNPPLQVPKSVLQVLLAHAQALEQHSRESVATPDMKGLLHESIGSANVEIDRDFVARALDTAFDPRKSDQQLVAAAADVVTRAVGRLDVLALADRHPIPSLAPPTSVGKIAGMEPDKALLKGSVGLQVIGELLHRASWEATFHAALETITKIDSLEERRLLLSETLDCCSHRLDAWLTATAARRLADLRGTGAKGTFIGAYAWLENIELRTPTNAGQVDGRTVLHDGADGGYIHAPSLTHAATAGVLRSGRLTHRRGDPNDEPLNIDLSSTRTRDALDLLDGMRRGQSLGALLGYRLERRLHERSRPGLALDRFIYVLRTLAPLRAGKLTESGVPVEEALAASDVVDGLRLLELDSANVRNKLNDGPADTRYIVPPDKWQAATVAEADAVVQCIAELDQTHDAVADLLLAESVHQLVSGNPTRAAATLDVLGAGEAVPPEPEVVRTPRTGVPIQHRVAIVIADPLPAAVPSWNTSTPRALAEPRLDRWAQHALGRADEIRIAADSAATLADTGLCALDVLYDADGDAVSSSTLAALLREKLPALGDDLSPLAPVWELAGLFRTVLLAGRALDVADLGNPIEESAVGRLADVEELLARANAALASLRSAISSADPLPALHEHGVRPPPARGTLPLTTTEAAAATAYLINEGEVRATQAAQLLARITAETPRKSKVELATKALSTIFGSSFLALPRLLAPPPGESDLWTGGVGVGGIRARAGAEIRPWLTRMGTIRVNTSAFGTTLLAREALARRPLLRTVQTPLGACATWVGLRFPDAGPPTVPVSSMIVEVAGATAGSAEPDLGGAVAGVLLDEWTEVVPRRLQRRNPNKPELPPEIVDVTTTGVALNANAPGARPPQTILLALSADGADWNSDSLVRALDETMALARMRPLTLQQIPFVGCYLPALYFRDWSLQGEPFIDWSQIAMKHEFASAALKFVSRDG
jgi:hypothetical protein